MAQRVIVIGAGIAGLAAAHELEELGHDPLVLEAQNRPGGRIHTLRCFADDLYAEAGAMRIPRTHDLTLEWCAKFGLELRPFVMDNPLGLVHVGGQRLTSEQAGADPDALGFDVAEHEYFVSVYAGDQMINLHRRSTWQRDGFTLRAPAARPPCGDLCFVWEGSPESLRARLQEIGAAVEEGPVERPGGRRATATSVYVRDPDGNLVELMRYP